MRKVMNVFKRTVNMMLVLSILLSVLSVGVFAASVTDPVVVGVSMNETRSYITIKFDREIEAAVSSLTGKVKLSKGGQSLTTLSSTSKISISGYNMYITLTSPLTTSDNYFAITNGTLVGQTEVIETPLFDARGPELKEDNEVVLNSADNSVTIKFNCPIKGYPDNDSLKNGYITLARSGTSFSEIIPEDDISINTEDGEITIYLADWLSGSRSKFRIAAGKVQNASNGNLNLSDITTPAIDASETSAVPELDYVEVSADRATVTLYFTENIKNSFTTGVSSSVANSLLKSHILVSRGSSTKYEALGGTDTLTVGSNYLRIKFEDPLTASRNYIKIEKTSLTDYYGNYIFEDIVTDNITSGTSSSSATPAYASAFLSSSKKIVIYFTTPVQKNSDLTTSDLLSRIKISRNGGSYKSLTSSDSVTFSDNAMTIALREALSGTGNRVMIDANTISSKTGVLLSKSVTTSSLSAGMSDDSSSSSSDDFDVPTFSSITYDGDSNRVRIYFDRDIRKVSTANFNTDIYISRNGASYVSLSSSDIVTIAPSNALTIILAEPLSGTRNAFRIAGGTLADYDSGYVQNSTITTDYISASGEDSSSDSSDDSTTYDGTVTATLSEDLYSITLTFDEAIYNNQSSLEALKNKLQISRNGSFKALGSDDYIRLNSESNELFIMLAEPATEYFSQIKILAGALRTADGSSISGTLSTLPLGESTSIVRTYIDGVEVKGISSAETSGSSTIVSISDSSKLSSYTKAIELLVKVPTSSDSAVLNINGDTVELIKRYGGTIALSLGDSTYFIPASNISTISSTDMLSIAIKDSESATTQKIASASASDSFTIESPAKLLEAKIITATDAELEIEHPAFADKRFLISNPKDGSSTYTVVRIEESGKIVPLPSSADVKGGVVYITAKTMTDGNYAAIFSSRTLSTLSWVQSPTNALAARLILTQTSGSNINGDEAISRAEAVTIMSRTLGILEDSNGISPFFDMISTDSSFDAVVSTVAHGLISGYPDSTFKPTNKLTRAESMAIVARAMRFMNGKSVSASSEMTLDEANNVISKFADAGTVDNWAKVDIAECVQAGVVNGDNHGNLNPKSNVTRAEFIQLMYNVLNSADMF